MTQRVYNRLLYLAGWNGFKASWARREFLRRFGTEPDRKWRKAAYYEARDARMKLPLEY